MSKQCGDIHKLTCRLERHTFPFNVSSIPLNGIYILFQKTEIGHGQDRIVRVGTHTGNDQLCSRLKQHFLSENKDRSIFRKNIGRAILNKRNDPYLKLWEFDLTTRIAKEKHSSLIDIQYQKQVESEVSTFIREKFSFVAFEVKDKVKRLEIESRLISTVSLCDECKSSDSWLGSYSPKNKIVQSGLWLVNELYKTPLDAADIEYLKSLVENQLVQE